LSHAEYEVLDIIAGARPSGSALGTAIILLGNEFPMPGQQCVRRNKVRNVIQQSPTHKFGFGRQTATLIIGKPKPTSAKLLSENSILFPQVLDGMLLLLVHPSAERNDYELERI
jgi:hypothetical protein